MAQSRPEARTFRVEELLAHTRAGRIRVPTFQRAFKWDREDVQKLLDSIWRGYPIGTLLLWQRVGAAGPVALGDLVFEVSEQSAWFVVDGQQRIVSLVSTLLGRGGRSATFDLYFDLVKAEIVPPGRHGGPATHLPLDRVVDSEHLLAWIDESRATVTPEQVRLALRVGKAFREYEIPAYVVSIDDESVVREIFERTNTTGKALAASEVFHALHAPTGREPATGLGDLIERLHRRSFGELEEEHVLRGLLAIAQRDPFSGDLQRQLQGLDVPRVVERVERAMERAFGFLAQDAGVPHLRLLPYHSALLVLSAYFDRFPTPSSRARRLLTRWLWRGSMTGELAGDGRGTRPALEAVGSAPGDEVAARTVLLTVATRRPGWMPSTPFDLRHARSRIAVIALVDLEPRDLRTSERINMVAWLDSAHDLMPQIVNHRVAASSDEDVAMYSSVGNRILHPGDDESVLSILVADAPSPHTLASHAISTETLATLRAGDRVGFVLARRDAIDTATVRLIDRHAEWDHSDRVSIATLSSEDD